MILYAFRPHYTETAPAWPGAALRSWRWAVLVERWSLVLEEQVDFNDGDGWGRANRYFGLYPSRSWRFGFYHLYYDGPHHSLWLGCLNVAWMRDAWCPICEPGREEDTSGAVQGFIEAVLAAALLEPIHVEGGVFFPVARVLACPRVPDPTATIKPVLASSAPAVLREGEAPRPWQAGAPLPQKGAR